MKKCIYGEKKKEKKEREGEKKGWFVLRWFWISNFGSSFGWKWWRVLLVLALVGGGSRMAVEPTFNQPNMKQFWYGN